MLGLATKRGASPPTSPSCRGCCGVADAKDAPSFVAGFPNSDSRRRGYFLGQTCSVTKPKALSAWWILVTPTTSTMASLELSFVSMLLVAMKYSLPWKLK
jgi:hypothetical protein